MVASALFVTLSVSLIWTAFEDARHNKVAVWLLLLDDLLLVPHIDSLEKCLAGALVALSSFLLCKGQKTLGLADRILLPFLVSTIGFWPIVGFFVAEMIKLHTKKEGRYALLPWLITPSLLGLVVKYFVNTSFF